MTTRQEETGKISFLGISSIGDAHAKSGKPNQDAIGFNSMGDSFFVALSDGLGSCKRAEIGAQKAISICNDIFIELMNEKLEIEFKSISKRISELWTRAFSENSIKEYSATLKVVFLAKQKIVALSIGDGFLFIRANNVVHFLENEHTGFVNETACLHPDMVADDFITLETEKAGDVSVFLCTDGISSGIIEGRETELFDAIFSSKNIQILRPEIEHLLTEMSEYNSDDKTVGLVIYE